VLFHSYAFIFAFLPITFLLYFGINRVSPQKARFFLILASLLFYGWWNPLYVPLLIGSIGVNFSIGKRLGDHKDPMLLALGIAVNLGLLGYFKYTDFLLETSNVVLQTHFEAIELALPLAISFFTFQQIAFLVDSYRGECRVGGVAEYALFVSFFPQLIAGPIVHYQRMVPQFLKKAHRNIHYRNVVLGLFLFGMGLFKKVVIADTFAPWADSGFGNAQALNFFEAWSASLAYSFQIYFDFSGYTDMALGLALLFNIRLPMNFNSPYQATNLQAFWRRWHITLGNFLKHYLYIPLGGSRRGSVRTLINLFATFLLGGLWHGAGWGFILWGVLHGIGLGIYHLWSRLGVMLPMWLAWVLTFNFINMTWIFFRAESLGDAWAMIEGMLGLRDVVFPKQFESFLGGLPITFSANWLGFIGSPMVIFITIIGAFMVVLLFPNSHAWMRRFRPNLGYGVVLFMLFWSAFAFLGARSEPFVYFQF